MTLNNWLNKPYPLIERPKDKWLLAFSFGIFVALFLIIFKPFGADEVKADKWLFLAGFGICVFVGLVINYLCLPIVFKKTFNKDKWQVYKEIIYIFWSFLLIAVFNFFYNTYFGSGIAKSRTFWEFFGITSAIGTFPVVILTFLIERNLSQRNTQEANLLSKTLSDRNANPEDNKTIQILPETLKTEPLEIYLNDFLFAPSDNNYTTIFYLSESIPKRKLFRLSFKTLENQLSEFNNIIRCHRSYIVNKDKITAIKGNARSMVLEVEHYEDMIPVSRSFPKSELI